jgi:hypothetical protein
VRALVAAEDLVDVLVGHLVLEGREHLVPGVGPDVVVGDAQQPGLALPVAEALAPAVDLQDRRLAGARRGGGR